MKKMFLSLAEVFGLDEFRLAAVPPNTIFDLRNGVIVTKAGTFKRAKSRNAWVAVA